jgi:proteasome assembly chaperone (PAC2) family protein
MIQVHIELLFNELEDLWLENIIEYTVDVDCTILLEGIPCIGAASKLVEDMFGIEVERICFL